MFNSYELKNVNLPFLKRRSKHQHMSANAYFTLYTCFIFILVSLGISHLPLGRSNWTEISDLCFMDLHTFLPGIKPLIFITSILLSNSVDTIKVVIVNLNISDVSHYTLSPFLQDFHYIHFLLFGECQISDFHDDQTGEYHLASFTFNLSIAINLPINKPACLPKYKRFH